MKTVIFVPSVEDKYHFGSKDWEETRIYCPSHTFFSAIVNNYVYVYRNKNVEKLKNLKVSGIFPCLLDQKNEPFLYFVPKPMGKLNICKDFADENSKKIKKVEFISLGFLKKQNDNELKKEDFVILGEKFLMLKEEFEEICEKITGKKQPDEKRKDEIKDIKLIGSQTEIKTAVDRMKGSSLESNLYTVKYIKPLFYVKDNNKKEIAFKVGFWAVVDIPNEIENEVIKSIKMIKKQGLGGEISSGAGLFDDIKTLNEDVFKGLNGSKYMSLSSYIPKKEEWENKNEWNYQIERYSGWMFSYTNPKVIGEPKKSIFYLTAGSVFDKEVEGEIKNLSTDPNQPCWFNGKPILIKINLKGEDNEM